MTPDVFVPEAGEGCARPHSARAPSAFQRDVVRELACMAELGACDATHAARAQKAILSQPDIYTDAAALSVSEAASAALELARMSAASSITSEPIFSVRIGRRSTSERTYDAITVVVGDLHLSCDAVSSRQIRLAARLAELSGLQLIVEPELSERVRSALAEGGANKAQPAVYEHRVLYLKEESFPTCKALEAGDAGVPRACLPSSPLLGEPQAHAAQDHEYLFEGLLFA